MHIYLMPLFIIIHTVCRFIMLHLFSLSFFHSYSTDSSQFFASSSSSSPLYREAPDIKILSIEKWMEKIYCNGTS